MDIERAIEHILDLQARAEVRMDRAEVRMDRAEVRMDRAEARMDRTDRQIRGIQKLIQMGMKLLVQTQKAGKQTDARLAELAAAQLKTDRKLDKLIELSLKRPPNGHG